jgi:putative membrane protein
MMYGSYGNGWGGSWLVMALMFLVFWGVVVSLVIYLLRGGQVRNDAGQIRPAHHDAERILTERFARGELDEEEFTKRRAALRRTE